MDDERILQHARDVEGMDGSGHRSDSTRGGGMRIRRAMANKETDGHAQASMTKKASACG